MNYFDRLTQTENDTLVLRILLESKCIDNALNDIGEALDGNDIDLMKGQILNSIGACGLTLDEILADVWELVYGLDAALSQDVKDELFKFQRDS